jgi:Ca2+-binding RTX toxin-like protein
MWENLESRLLLSASLSGGVLTINGTDRNDNIYTHTNGSSLIVFFNGAETRFRAANVSRIVINGRAGDDYILNGAANIPARLTGGAGNDFLSGGSQDDTLSGGAGNDSLYGQAGSDSLDGGEGDDILAGGIGDDLLDGGGGADQLLGGGGDDWIISRDSTHDTVNGGDGQDTGALDDLLDSSSGIEQLIPPGSQVNPPHR